MKALLFANVIGVDVQDFNTTPSGLDFVTVHASETLAPGIFNLGLFVNLAANTLPHYTTQGSGREERDKISDTLVGADFNVGLGLLPRWDVGLSFPQILRQDVKDDTPEATRGQFAATGLTEIRLTSKVQLAGDQNGGVAVALSVNFNRVKDNPYTGVDAGPTYNAELATDKMVLARLALGLNVGYRWRDAGKPPPGSPVEPFSDQATASGAASWHVPDADTKVIVELYGARMQSKIELPSDRKRDSLEALLGAKHDVSTRLALHAGIGTGVIKGVATPDWRVYTGVNYAFGTSGTRGHAAGARRKPVPSVAPSPSPEASEVVVLPDILFAFDSDEETSGMRDASLAELTVTLRAPPKAKRVAIEGHSDSVGDEGYNVELSRRRAESVRGWLVARGFPQHLFTVEGFGSSRPIGDNGNYQGRQKNRRVELKVFR